MARNLKKPHLLEEVGKVLISVFFRFRFLVEAVSGSASRLFDTTSFNWVSGSTSSRLESAFRFREETTSFTFLKPGVDFLKKTFFLLGALRQKELVLLVPGKFFVTHAKIWADIISYIIH